MSDKKICFRCGGKYGLNSGALFDGMWFVHGSCPDCEQKQAEKVEAQYDGKIGRRKCQRN